MKMNKLEFGKLGWIGTGILGSAIIKNLSNNGFKVIAYNRTIAKAKDLTSSGILIAEDIQELFLNTKIIFTCLGNYEAFNDLLLSKIDVFNKYNKKPVIIDLATISPQLAIETSTKLRNNDIGYLECPVSGGKEGAIAGVMTAICAGNKEVFDYVKEILKSFCLNIHYVGEAGNAQKLKIINNLAESINLLCASEVILLGIKQGFGIDTLRDILKTARGKSAYMDLLLDRLHDKSTDTAVTLEVRTKDLNLAKSLIEDTGIKSFLSNVTIDFFKKTKDIYGELEDQSKCFDLLKYFNSYSNDS